MARTACSTEVVLHENFVTVMARTAWATAQFLVHEKSVIASPSCQVQLKVQPKKLAGPFMGNTSKKVYGMPLFDWNLNYDNSIFKTVHLSKNGKFQHACAHSFLKCCFHL
jgi:hypothetical protein